MTDGEMNQWASFSPTLLAACAATSGPILECGCGFNSTLLLHAICAPTKRRLLTLEGNVEWLERFRNLETNWHALGHARNWDGLDIGIQYDCRYDVAFVDHDRVPRGPLVGLLRERARFVVMHDSECNYCGYGPHLAEFDWCYTHKFSPAWTTIAGMGERPAWIESALTPGDWGIPVPYRG